MGRRVLAIACSLIAGCVFEPPYAILGDPDPEDTGSPVKDATSFDAAEPDAAELDASVLDATNLDATNLDATNLDASEDAANMDAAIDAEPADAGEVDAGEPEVDIPHLAPADRVLGTDSVSLDSQTIDTTNLTLGIALPAGASFTAVAQFPGGPELAVLRAGSVEVVDSAIVRVIGARPLVVLSRDEVRVRGTIDIAAEGPTPGAGGYDPGAGPGAGSDALQSGSYSDPGGGGAGHATEGRAGGTGEAGALAGGLAGPVYGDAIITTLEGGSGGGRGRPGGCTRVAGGAGGGALQIYSATRIRIESSGVIDAGGGGGRGGDTCLSGNAGAGSGGGSGGAVLLMAPEVEQLGRIAANGGGGGGGASSSLLGYEGADGTMDASAAIGGPARGTYGFPGGSGGFGTTLPMEGTAAPGTLGGGGNAGSGGGAVGRIRILTRIVFMDQGTISPPPSAALYP